MQEMPFSDSHHAISRRRFIRNAAIAGAAPLVIPAGSLAKEGEEKSEWQWDSLGWARKTEA